jgi:hypothetical protein
MTLRGQKSGYFREVGASKRTKWGGQNLFFFPIFFKELLDKHCL